MTVTGPVKKAQPDGMSHGGWGRGGSPKRPFSDREGADLHRSVQPLEPRAVCEMRVEAGDMRGLTVPEVKPGLGICQRLHLSIRRRRAQT